MFKTVKYPSLAIIGVGVKGVNLKDFNAFGFQVFHGTDHLIPKEKGSLSGLDFQALIDETTQNTHLDLSEIGIITCMNQFGNEHDLKELCQTAKFHHDLEGTTSDPWITASEHLKNNAADAVLILEEGKLDHTLYTVLVCTEATASEADFQVFAFIYAEADQAQVDGKGALVDLLHAALASETSVPNPVGLLITSAPLGSAPELLAPQVLNAGFGSQVEKSCAITGGDSGLRSILKSVWCLTHRLIPGTSDWHAPADPTAWQQSPFYIPTESRTWFTSTKKPYRTALVINANDFGFESVLRVREGYGYSQESCTCLKQEPTLLLPIGGDTKQEFLANLTDLGSELGSVCNLKKLSIEKLMRFHEGQLPDRFVACLIGETKDDFFREIKFAQNGIPKSIENQSGWQTPKGSYFTPEPLGDSGTVSFVYPGGFNSYIGIGKDLLYFFPYLHNEIERLTQDLGDLMNEKILYPRKISALSSADVVEAESRLAADSLAMLISGISLSTMFTLLLRDIFGVHPTSALGYSLGEISMMFANGIWTQVDESSDALFNSPLFSTRLAGPQNAIREFWNLSTSESTDPKDAIWENYVIMAGPSETKKAMVSEDRVFLTHINTPDQVVIGGDPAAVRRVINSLQCNSLKAPFNYAIHCDAMRSEFNEFKRLLSWSVSNQTEMRLYSAAHYQAMPLNQDEIAEHIAHGLCHPLDFPQLIQSAYSDGARIFIELGAGGNCTRWINESLKDAPHVAFSSNRKGLNDHCAVLQLLARLISHRVPINLSAFIG